MNNILTKTIHAQEGGANLEKPLKLPGIDLSNPADVGWDQVLAFILSIIDLLLYFAGIVSLIMIFYAAMLYALAYGEESKVETAKKTILWAIIGLVIVALAATIVWLVKGQLNSSAYPEIVA